MSQREANNPTLTIITVTYNAEQQLPATLASVAEQTVIPNQYLIIDGASTDHTLELAQKADIPSMEIHSEPDSGIYDAMNRGLGYATGDYVLFLNAGDRLHDPDTVKDILEAARDNDRPGIIYGQTDIVDARGRRLADRHLRAPRELTLASFRDGMTVCHQAFVVLRRITDPYNLKYRLSADYDWCIRCLQHSRRNVYLDRVIADFLNEGATSRHRLKSLTERFRIMSTYYGLLPTILRHFGFLPRYIRRRRLERKLSKCPTTSATGE